MNRLPLFDKFYTNNFSIKSAERKAAHQSIKYSLTLINHFKMEKELIIKNAGSVRAGIIKSMVIIAEP
jgi:hypothetical protein